MTDEMPHMLPIVIPPPEKATWKWQVVTFLRQLAVAVITAVVIVLILTVAFHAQTAADVQRQEDTLHANLAQACVLSLPVDENGRNPDDVMECFTQYGLQAPLIQENPGKP